MIRVLDSRTWAPGDPAGLLDDLLEERPRRASRWRRASDPDRPAQVPAGTWRRMSRLARAVAAVSVPLVAERADRDRLPVVWGTAFGELVPTGRFLDRLFTEGPKRVSPLAFQNSVYNAPVGHLSIALGLRGPSETLSAGGATGLAALLRGAQILRSGAASAVLVVAGDDLNAPVQRSYELLGGSRPVGEAVAAVLLGVEGAEAPGLSVQMGVAPAPGCVFSRQAPLPPEADHPPRALPGALAPETALGLVPSASLTVVAAIARGIRAGRLSGASVVDHDLGHALTARLGDAVDAR